MMELFFLRKVWNVLKIVLNNTVHVSAKIKLGPGATKLNEAWLAGKFDIIISEPILSEMVNIFRAEDADEQDIKTLEKVLRAYGILVKPTERINACRDPDDNKFLEAAVTGRADYFFFQLFLLIKLFFLKEKFGYIVSGDKDLRVLSPFRGIPIVTVRKCLRIIGI
ncbi:putative toxin-antitoxin system toxin component, PIN family [Candidatus Poribacteria bacterium]|nr:putative toxin-antitoxin system toxin component, PIN family [Candidatus Poribacteria bacterium]